MNNRCQNVSRQDPGCPAYFFYIQRFRQPYSIRAKVETAVEILDEGNVLESNIFFIVGLDPTIQVISDDIESSVRMFSQLLAGWAFVI